MALKTTNLNGSVEGVSTDYPWGALKNSPGGTRVNKKMLDGMWQFYQKIMDMAGITPNELLENATNGYQYVQAVVKLINSHCGPIIINMLGVDYDAAKVYVLSGVAGTTPTWVFYNGELYYLRTAPIAPCLDTLVIVADGLYQAGIKSMKIICGTSGSGIVDLANVVVFSAWVSAGSTTFTALGGGSITVGGGDVVYNKYMLRGKTVHYQLQVRNATISGTVVGIRIEPTFFTGAANDGAIFPAIYNSFATASVLISSATLLLAVEAGTFTTGTNNQNFDINIVFENNY